MQNQKHKLFITLNTFKILQNINSVTRFFLICKLENLIKGIQTLRRLVLILTLNGSCFIFKPMANLGNF